MCCCFNPHTGLINKRTSQNLVYVVIWSRKRLSATNIRWATYVIMVVADVLVPNRRQEISNRHDDSAVSAISMNHFLQIYKSCCSEWTCEWDGEVENPSWLHCCHWFSPQWSYLRPSYLHNGISHTGKMTSLYWIRACGYRQVSNIRRTLEGNKIIDHSDVVGASPVGAAPTTSSFST